jgi:single-strand DNA-binding protein
VAWRGTAEFLCKFFGKGRMVVATGRLQTRTWKDKHDQTRKETELNATNLYFGDTKKLEQVADIYQQAGNAYDEITEDDGELPF